MPQFFFHHHTPQTTMRDDMGCSFASLELAYLDAYRSMIEIGAELIKQQKDPSRHRMEIADNEGRVLMELHFSDVFRGRHASQIRDSQARKELLEKLTRSRRLKSEMQEVCELARASVAKAREMLKRAKSTA